MLSLFTLVRFPVFSLAAPVAVPHAFALATLLQFGTQLVAAGAEFIAFLHSSVRN
jgi:hypothetical protein